MMQGQKTIKIFCLVTSKTGCTAFIHPIQQNKNTVLMDDKVGYFDVNSIAVVV
jgi:hypothetical protein